MKIKQLIFPVLLTILVSCGNPDYDEKASAWIDTLEEIPANEQKEAPDDAPYGFETGIIEYESSTLGMTQQIITMFSDFGRISSTEIKTKMLGQSINQLTLVNDTAIFTINLIDSTGTYVLLDSNETELNFRHLSKEDMEKNKIKKTGNETVLEKNCTIYELFIEEQNAEIKNWIWEGLTLKNISNIGGMTVTMDAQKLRVNVQIPPEKFYIPKGFNIQKSDSDSLFVL
ncbi:MAG: hypothetical protein JXR53_11760 [Bacteroidales bacterium]|nr:hypothetical protein [Bacteroidales bacterium]